jgi:enoyl-CoA hydratase/carnithine racemase
MIVARMRAMSKPVIAMINGRAHGAGFNLALGCDLRVAADSATLSIPFARRGIATGTSRPIHVGTLPIMGVHLIDNADLDELAATAAHLGRYEFQFVMGPLILKRGTASPVNPLAIF